MAWFSGCAMAPTMRGRRAARKLRIGVEREDVADLRKHVEAAGLDGEGVVLAHEKLVQVEQLAALSLPAHPNALAHVEDAMAVKEQETAGLGATHSVAFSSSMSWMARSTSGLESSTCGLLTESGRSVSKTKCRLRIAIGEIAHFEFVNELANLLLIQQQRGYRDQRGALAGECPC